MFEELYEMYGPEEQEVVALISHCTGGGFNWEGNLWEMTVVTLGMVFCDTGKVSTKEERSDRPVTDEECNSDKGWGHFQNEQICRLKIRRMKEKWAKDLVAWPWCTSQVVKAREDCPELQAVLDEYHKPVVIQDEVLGESKLDKDYDTFEGEIQWYGTGVSPSLEVNAENKSSWTRARNAAKKPLAGRDTWDKVMRELVAKNLTELANNWPSQDEGNPRNLETGPITEEELARRISMTSLFITSGGSFTAWFDCDEMFTDHVVAIYGSLKKGLKAANIGEQELSMEKATAVSTCLGVLEERDCIYLDQVKRDELNNLTFTGDINGHLVSQHGDEKDWFPYTLTFRRVLVYSSRELDTYKNTAGTEYIAGSSFDSIEDSTWLRSLPVREDFDKGIYQYYRLFIYDDVYDIIAVSYEFVAKL